jgi:hypothetical protein
MILGVRFSVGLISNDFDANEFKREEEEQEEEDRISDVVSKDSMEVEMLCRHQFMLCQYRFMLCQYQYQLKYFMLCWLGED